MALQARAARRAAARRPALTRVRVVCASANPDKVAEIAALLDGVVDLLPRPADVPDVVEDADTLEGNARLKAVGDLRRHRRCRRWPTTPACSSSALGGAPGVQPARFAGEDATYADNCAKLLDELAGLPTAPSGRRLPHGGAGALAVGRGAGRRGRVPRPDRHARCGPAGASATTRCSSPTRATAARSARCPQRRRTRSPIAAGRSPRC